MIIQVMANGPENNQSSPMDIFSSLLKGYTGFFILVLFILLIVVNYFGLQDLYSSKEIINAILSIIVLRVIIHSWVDPIKKEIEPIKKEINPIKEQVNNHIPTKINKVKEELKSDINRVENRLDKIIKILVKK